MGFRDLAQVDYLYRAVYVLQIKAETFPSTAPRKEVLHQNANVEVKEHHTICAALVKDFFLVCFGLSVALQSMQKCLYLVPANTLVTPNSGHLQVI